MRTLASRRWKARTSANASARLPPSASSSAAAMADSHSARSGSMMVGSTSRST